MQHVLLLLTLLWSLNVQGQIVVSTIPKLNLSHRESVQLTVSARKVLPADAPFIELTARADSPPNATVLFGPKPSHDHLFAVDFVRCTRDMGKRWHCQYDQRVEFVQGDNFAMPFRLDSEVSPVAAWAVFREANRVCHFDSSGTLTYVPLIAYEFQSGIYRLWWEYCNYEFTVNDGEATSRRIYPID